MQLKFKSHNYDFTEEIIKIALSSNDDKKQDQLIRQKDMHTE